MATISAIMVSKVFCDTFSDWNPIGWDDKIMDEDARSDLNRAADLSVPKPFAVGKSIMHSSFSQHLKLLFVAHISLIGHIPIRIPEKRLLKLFRQTLELRRF